MKQHLRVYLCNIVLFIIVLYSAGSVFAQELRAEVTQLLQQCLASPVELPAGAIDALQQAVDRNDADIRELFAQEAVKIGGGGDKGLVFQKKVFEAIDRRQFQLADELAKQVAEEMKDGVEMAIRTGSSGSRHMQLHDKPPLDVRYELLVSDDDISFVGARAEEAAAKFNALKKNKGLGSARIKAFALSSVTDPTSYDLLVQQIRDPHAFVGAAGFGKIRQEIVEKGGAIILTRQGNTILPVAQTVQDYVVRNADSTLAGIIDVTAIAADLKKFGPLTMYGSAIRQMGDSGVVQRDQVKHLLRIYAAMDAAGTFADAAAMGGREVLHFRKLGQQLKVAYQDKTGKAAAAFFTDHNLTVLQLDAFESVMLSTTRKLQRMVSQAEREAGKGATNIARHPELRRLIHEFAAGFALLHQTGHARVIKDVVPGMLKALGTAGEQIDLFYKVLYTAAVDAATLTAEAAQEGVARGVNTWTRARTPEGLILAMGEAGQGGKQMRQTLVEVGATRMHGKSAEGAKQLQKILADSNGDTFLWKMLSSQTAQKFLIEGVAMAPFATWTMYQEWQKGEMKDLSDAAFVLIDFIPGGMSAKKLGTEGMTPSTALMFAKEALYFTPAWPFVLAGDVLYLSWTVGGAIQLQTIGEGLVDILTYAGDFEEESGQPKLKGVTLPGGIHYPRDQVYDFLFKTKAVRVRHAISGLEYRVNNLSEKSFKVLDEQFVVQDATIEQMRMAIQQHLDAINWDEAARYFYQGNVGGALAGYLNYVAGFEFVAKDNKGKPWARLYEHLNDQMVNRRTVVAQTIMVPQLILLAEQKRASLDASKNLPQELAELQKKFEQLRGAALEVQLVDMVGAQARQEADKLARGTAEEKLLASGQYWQDALAAYRRIVDLSANIPSIIAKRTGYAHAKPLGFVWTGNPEDDLRKAEQSKAGFASDLAKIRRDFMAIAKRDPNVSDPADLQAYGILADVIFPWRTVLDKSDKVGATKSKAFDTEYTAALKQVAVLYGLGQDFEVQVDTGAVKPTLTDQTGVAKSQSSPDSPGRRVRVAVMAPLTPKSSEVDQALRAYLGQEAGIQFILEPRTAEEFFDELAAFTRDGKQIEYLVIAGHGSCGWPHIQFQPSRDLDSESLDLDGQREKIGRHLDMLRKLKRQYCDLKLSDNVNEAAQRRMEDIEGHILTNMDEIREAREKLAALEKVQDVMAEGARILLINCSAACDEQGRQFVRAIGRTLLWKRGGSIIASKRDVDIGQAGSGDSIAGGLWTWLQSVIKTGGASWGEYYLSGKIVDWYNWVTLEVPREEGVSPFDRALPVEVAPRCSRVAEGQTLLLQAETKAFSDSGVLAYTWQDGCAQTDGARCAANTAGRAGEFVEYEVAVRDARGRTGRDAVYVRVDAPDYGLLLEVGDAQPASGATVEVRAVLKGRTPPPADSYWHWSVGGGLSLSDRSDATARVLVNGAGTLEAKLLVAGPFGKIHTLAEARQRIEPRLSSLPQEESPGPGVESGSSSVDAEALKQANITVTAPSIWPGVVNETGLHLKRQDAKGGATHEMCPYPAGVFGEVSGKVNPSFAPRSVDEIRAKFEQDKLTHEKWGRTVEIRPFSIGDYQGLMLESTMRYLRGGWSGDGYRDSRVEAFGHAFVTKGGRTIELTYSVGSGGCWDNSQRAFQESQTAAARAEAQAILAGIRLSETPALVQVPYTGPKLDGSDLPVVRLRPEKIPVLKVGETFTVEAVVENAKSEDSPFSYEWTGTHGNADELKSAVATIMPDAAGKFSVTVAVGGARHHLGSAALEYTVADYKVHVERVPADTGPVSVGTRVGFVARLTVDGQPAQGDFIYRWQPHPEASFDRRDAAEPDVRAVFHAPGLTGVWVQVLERREGREITVAESAQLEIEVVAPKLSLVMEPAEPLVGQDVKARLAVEPEMKELDLRWVPLSFNAKQGPLSADGRELSFYLKDDKPVALTVMARVPVSGESLGMAQGSVTARKYAVTISGPKAMGPPPRVWKEGVGLVEVAGAIAVDQIVEFVADTQPAALSGPVRYQWKVTGGPCSMSNPISREARVTAGEAGTCELVVVVRDRNDVGLGSAAASFTASVTREAVQQGSKKALGQNGGVVPTPESGSKPDVPAQVPVDGIDASDAGQGVRGSGTGSALVGVWDLNANSYAGKIEFQQDGGRITGRLWLSGYAGWEELQAVAFDGVNLTFTRPIPGLDQRYTGVMSAGEVQGTFDQAGTGSYPWWMKRGPM